MAWPQAPQPAPAPSQSPGSSLPLGPLVTAVAGLLTFIFSFVQIVKTDSGFDDIGRSVWTTDPGFFGIGTWIPVLGVVAAAAAAVGTFAKGLGAKQVGGFGLLQVQVVAVVFAVLLWLGYMVNILLSDFVTFGLGAFLLFIGLLGLVAGTGLSLLDQRRATTAGLRASPGGPPSGQWGPPSGPQPHSAPQPTPPPQPDPAQWQQPAAPAPGQWQPDPAAPPPPPTWAPPPGPAQAWQPPAAPSDPYQPQPGPPGPVPEPGPLDPQPAPPGPQPGPPGGALVDPGTQVIPGPPPAPPADDPDDGGPGALPPIPPSNTP